MSARNRFFILLGIIFVIAASYYFLSTDHSRDLVLIGTVDANQVIVSAQVSGRIQKLLVDEGTPVKAGDLIAVLDPSELQAQEAAATAAISSLQHKVTEMQHTEESTKGSTSSDVANAQAKLSSAKAQLIQAKAQLDRTEKCNRTEEPGSSPPRLYERLCPGERDGFRTCCAAGRGRQHRCAHCDHR